MLVATFRYAHQDFAVSTRELPGNAANPGCEMAIVLELRPIPNGGHNRCGCFGPHTLDLGNPLTSVIAAVAIAADAMELEHVLGNINAEGFDRHCRSPSSSRLSA
jgi:hypothetical protein